MSLDAVRNEIREIDERIIDLVAERQRLAARIARLKQESGLPIRDDEQRRVVLDRVFTYAVKNQIDPVAVRKIFEILIEMNEEQQRECAGDGDLP
ncbi:MAG TPA: chorismate mutase [Candidatus Methanoculleus thermohydrogenotrophicum]|jgi:chorismate mutase|nr:chorismate mutase [Candidatus Methanoculleus thermohydrogenotrophicum]NLM81188.1 chorismate mutase [Candidatus Methanoculleus thermohydrogenotrophicum]HOB17211.1 chorismate mutase [Candidatus Methanoculleus thermohydrogenotrophicum]HPZ38867.1 chorismate mutase [Candidatus Methanoculleus thermohydrogenotrophicum]HQC90496.1 chorismate mutase [Candidatus Methanoculleus thermohydrogenotrophicum]